MKTKIKLFALISTSCLMLALPISCNSTTKNDPKTLNVVLYNAGWGDEWFKDVIAKWENNNPGYTVNLTSKYEVKELINRRLASSKNTDDLYIATDNGWRNFAAQGKFAPLDDLLEEEVENGIKFKDKVDDVYANDLYFKNKDGSEHVYRLPWTSGMGGIYYNETLFKENNLTIPKTTDELMNLVKYVVENKIEVPGDDTAFVKPFVYTGDNTDYFDYTIFNWWLQLSGYDNVKNFYNYKNAEQFNYQAEGTYKDLYTVVKYWRELFSNKDYFISGSLGYTNHDAQKQFFNGKALMMFNGDWLYNETLEYGQNSKFSLKIMPTPIFKNAKETNVAYTIGSDQYIAIPATSIKQDLAKSFLKEMVKDWSLANFTNKSHGFLAYKLKDQSLIDTSNTYVSSYLDVRNAIQKSTTDESKSMMFLNGDIKNAWIVHANRPFLGLLQNSSQTVESSFDSLYSAAKALDWSSVK